MAFYSPTPKGSRYKRQAYSSPTRIGLKVSDLTPADSRYGSTLISPDRWDEENLCVASSLCELLNGNLDGGRSPDSSSSDGTGDVTGFKTPQMKPGLPRRPRSATLPRLPERSRSTLPASFFSESSLSNTDRSSETRPRRPRSSSLRAPDRFVPARDSTTPVSDIFKITKGVSQMSTSEKLLRNKSAASDAFVYRRRLVSPMASTSDYRFISRSDTGAIRTGVGTTLAPLQSSSSAHATGPSERQASYGSVWTVGGVAPSGSAVDDGRGHLVQTGTSARLFRTTFSTAKPKQNEELEKHRERLATALELDQTQRVFEFDLKTRPGNRPQRGRASSFTPRKTFWDGAQWVHEGPIPDLPKPPENRAIPIAPFKVLDAPNLKDDFYCSLLAYSPNCHTLVVGLGNLLYAWSEKSGVRLINTSTRDGAWLTSLAFSSTQGCKAILAYGRSNCVLSLMSLYDGNSTLDGQGAPALAPALPRFEVRHPAPIRCVRWRPTYTIRRSGNPHNSHRRTLAKMEDLLVGNEVGTVYYYSVEWPERWEVNRDNYSGEMVLMAIIKVHTQQICGLSWSPKGDLFATGGNDNLCSLFETANITSRWDRATRAAARRESQRSGQHISDRPTRAELLPQAVEIKPGEEKQKWYHAAAVKAIAFCPWQDGLVATGGGSNDKCIHFFHTCSGAALATISVSAQVTSLIWSNTRREIVATFGYAEPDHPYRIAIFSWPDCRQVGAIPWEGGHRALYAVPFPGRARDADRRTRNRASAEGCIVVASSDCTVKFHEVWGEDTARATAMGAGGTGMLGGSEILEHLQGLDKEGDVIR